VARDSDVETFCAVRTLHRLMAVGGGTVVSAFGKASPGDGRRGAGGAEAAAAQLFADSAPPAGPRIICAFPPLPTPRSPWPLASSARAKSSSATNGSCNMVEELIGANRPTSDC